MCLGNLGQRIQHSVNPWLVQKTLQLTVQFAWTDLYTLSRVVHRIKDPNKAVAALSQRPRKQVLLLGQCFPLSQFTMPFCHILWLFFGFASQLLLDFILQTRVPHKQQLCPSDTTASGAPGRVQGPGGRAEHGLGPGASSLWC